jgi:hypothetical protein
MTVIEVDLINPRTADPGGSPIVPVRSRPLAER